MLLQIYYMEKYIFPYYPNISPLVFGGSREFSKKKSLDV
jgi:hypothetical protein